MTEWNDFIGRFEAVDGVDVKARVSGYLDKVHFQDGAIVKAGDLLFTIDQRTYRATLAERHGRQGKRRQGRSGGECNAAKTLAGGLVFPSGIATYLDAALRHRLHRPSPSILFNVCYRYRAGSPLSTIFCSDR